ncbi:hypothetical protein HY024_00760 [Candidatus Curtissbacteria bacterium]|nr:hypothetical protein [Candidatus Curtissbacteria bacterium]
MTFYLKRPKGRFFIGKMERAETTINSSLIRYPGVIHRLRELAVIHATLQRAVHGGLVSREFFTTAFKGLMKEKELEIVKAACIAVNTEDKMARGAAFDVLTSFANDNAVRLTTQSVFLRNSGISAQLTTR